MVIPIIGSISPIFLHIFKVTTERWIFKVTTERWRCQKSRHDTLQLIKGRQESWEAKACTLDGVKDASTTPFLGDARSYASSKVVFIYYRYVFAIPDAFATCAYKEHLDIAQRSPRAKVQSMPVDRTVPRRDWPYKKAPTEYTLLYEGHVLAVSLADNKVMYPWDPPRGPTLQSIPVRSEVRRDFVDEKPRIKSSVSLTLSNPEDQQLRPQYFVTFSN